jgi:hypothetical protein
MRNIIRSFIAFFRSSKKTILLMLIVAILSIAVTTTISIMLSNIGNLSIPSLGNIKTIGVEAYWDPNCENKTETIDWGTMWPGSSKNVTLYIRSVSNVKTSLHLNTSDLNPADISEYISLSWNYNGTSLNPDGIIQVTLFLSVSGDKSVSRYLVANDVTDFSIDIHLVAIE